MDMFDLAGALFGNRTNTVAQGPSLTATGSTASTDGVAGVTFDGDVTPAEDVGEDVDQTVIDLPTSPDVAEGDEVIVTLVGDGPLKTPIVTANPGSGDRMAAAVADARDMASNAETLAEQAEAVASATGQHFWPDTDGVHVTEVTQDEWNDSTSPNYHSGANVLLNALGQLFRDGLNNLLALLPGTATTYTETFTAATDQTDFVLSHRPTRITSVTVDGSATTIYSVNGYTVTVPTIGAGGEVVAITYEYGGTSIAIFDGNGNQPENVVASFGEGGTIIGSEYGQHVEVVQDSVRIMGGQSDSQQLARFGSSATFGSESDPMLVIADNLIHFYRFENQLISFYFDDDAAIQSYANGNLSIVANGAISFNSGVHTVTVPNATGTLALDTVTTATLTRGSAAASWSSGQVRRSGKVVVVTIVNMKLASALASGANSATVATIPAGYRPNVLQRVPVALSGAGNYANCWGVVGTGGSIQIHNGSGLSIPTTMEISMNCAYIID